jgi:asparagine synthase (glutamine-hydrolysing)
VRATAESAPDRLGIAQALTFGWPLGTRTLVEEVLRVPAAASIELDLRSGESHLRRYHVWNLEELEASARRAPAACEELEELFVAGCRAQARWAADRTVVVGLSGGLDSRAAAAGMVKAGARVHAASFVDESGTDAALAARAAAALGIPHTLLRLRPPDVEAAERLVRLRDGNNYVGVAFTLEFLESVRERFGPRVCYVSGDGGDRVLPDLLAVPVRDLDAFTHLRLSKSIWPPAVVARLLGIKPGDLFEASRVEFAAYPERSSRFWGARFELFERTRNWLSEGEDRNRSFFWSLSPFYVQSFFRRCFAAPASAKRHHRLYARFLRRLSEPAARLPNAAWNARLGSPRATLLALERELFDRLPTWAQARVKSSMPFYRPQPDRNGSRAALRSLVGTLPGAGPFDAAALEQIVDRPMTRFQYELLATQLIYEAQRNAPAALRRAVESQRARDVVGAMRQSDVG